MGFFENNLSWRSLKLPADGAAPRPSAAPVDFVPLPVLPGARVSTAPQVTDKPVAAIQLPILEGEAGRTRSVCSARGDDSYVVDLAHYTCTCRSFKNGRGKFAETDIRRACHHISRLLLYEKRTGKLSDFLHVMIVHRLNYGRGIWSDMVRHPMRHFQIGGEEVLLVKGDSGGVDVFAPKQSASPGYGIFGYSTAKVRWSDMGLPKHHPLLTELIQQWVQADHPCGS